MNFATDKNRRCVIPSLLDRLFDDAGKSGLQAVDQGLQNLEELKATVARDLQALLNTVRTSVEDLSPEIKELPSSLAMYGVPDLSALSLNNPDHHEEVRRALEETVANFEPRLKRCRVTVEPTPMHSRMLRFRVEARLQVPPISEPVAFDTALELNRLAYKVKEQI